MNAQFVINMDIGIHAKLEIEKILQQCLLTGYDLNTSISRMFIYVRILSNYDASFRGPRKKKVAPAATETSIGPVTNPGMVFPQLSSTGTTSTTVNKRKKKSTSSTTSSRPSAVSVRYVWLILTPTIMANSDSQVFFPH